MQKLSVSKEIAQADKLRKRGALEPAAEIYRRVLDRFPKNPRARAGLSACQTTSAGPVGVKELHALWSAGRLDEAARMARILVRKTPKDPLVFGLYGAVLAGQGRTQDAVAAFRQMVKLKPDNADGHANLGKALLDSGDPDAAVTSLRRALSLNPNHNMAHTNLGNALLEQGDSSAAIAAYEKQLSLIPDHAEAGMSLAMALKDQGQKDKAVDMAVAVLAKNPNYALGHRNLSTLLRYDAETPHFQTLQSAYKSTPDGSPDRMQLAFALAKAHEDLGNIDAAFAMLQEGNQIHKSRTGYDAQRDRDVVTVIRRLFADGPLPERRDAHGHRPIFILGMPRSGTTLVEQILASHPDVTGGGELPFFHTAIWPLLQKAGAEPSFRIAENEIAQLRAQYHSGVAGRFGDVRVLTDKTPSNFRYIGFILAALPEARIIHLQRDPVAVAWSIYKRYFTAAGMDYSCDFNDIIAYFNGYRDLMALWSDLFPERIYNLSYEALTEDQEPQTRRLLEAADLDWDPACLEFHKTDRVVRTASSEQVRQKMYSGSSEAWRPFEAHLQPLINSLKP